MKRSIRYITQSIIQNDYERFTNQAIKENGHLIEEAIMVESEPIDHVQAMKDDNRKGVMNEEIKAIEKRKTRSWFLI